MKKVAVSLEAVYTHTICLINKRLTINRER